MSYKFDMTFQFLISSLKVLKDDTFLSHFWNKIPYLWPPVCNRVVLHCYFGGAIFWVGHSGWGHILAGSWWSELCFGWVGVTRAIFRLSEGKWS